MNEYFLSFSWIPLATNVANEAKQVQVHLENLLE